jgi:dTMP kinase
MAIGRFATCGLLPDLTHILVLPVEQAAARRGREPDRMEARGLAYLERVRQGFLMEAKRDTQRFHVIDASPDVQSLHRQVSAFVLSFLRKLGIEPSNQSN